MSMQVVPHLNFQGEARAALTFYQTVFGGDLTVVTYGNLRAVQQPGEENLVIWGQVAAENGFKVMAFDATARLPYDKGQNAYYVSARFDNDEEIQSCWEKLKAGATIRQELGPAPWAPTLYGMLEDRFGVVWVMDVSPSGAH